MGSIDLDPCSSAYFNETVKATQYYSLDDRGEDGLQLPWHGKVFVNPPGGLVKEFWKKAINERPSPEIFWVGFSLEQLSYLLDEPYSPMDFAFCLLRKRIRFTRHDGYSGSPSHSNYVAVINLQSRERFSEEFGPLGRVSFGVLG